MSKNKTTLTFYGGVNEIGGNKILLQDRDTKIFLDFGMSFSMKKHFYSPPFLSPKSEKSLQELDILPKLSGVYKFDHTAPEVDAILLSHGHLDHSAYLSFIKREIPVYCGETTQIILNALSDIRRTDLEFRVSDIKFKAFRTGKKITIDNLEIEPFHVDHSVPGAYGFVIHTSNGAVIYTGDFRKHGAKPEMTSDFVENARKADPIAIITEATNMTGATVSSENEVESKLNKIVAGTNGIVLAEFSYSDVDRLNSFFQIAKKNNRCLAISLKQAYLLDALQKDKGLTVPSLEDEEILIFRKSKKRFGKWEKELLNRFDKVNKILDAFEVSKHQCKVVLALSFYDFEELVQLRPEAGSCYVLSTSEPFNEEMEIDYERMINWMSYYGLPQYQVHVSGHIMPLQLRRVLEQVRAKRVFPVHTERAQLFSKFMREIKSKITLIEKKKEYKI